MHRSRRTVISFALVLVLVLVLGVGQLVLPSIAAHVVRERVERYGTVQSASVKAFPAIKLAWGDADSANVVIKTLRVTPKQALDLLSQSRGVKRMDISMQTFVIKTQAAGITLALPLRDVHVQKRGDTISAQASLSESDLKTALPEGSNAKLIASASGQLDVHLGGGFFQGDILVVAHNGALAVEPTGSTESLNVFSDHRITVEGVNASLRPSGAAITIRAKLR